MHTHAALFTGSSGDTGQTGGPPGVGGVQPFHGGPNSQFSFPPAFSSANILCFKACLVRTLRVSLSPVCRVCTDAQSCSAWRQRAARHHEAHGGAPRLLAAAG